jgi:hypothetical protein
MRVATLRRIITEVKVRVPWFEGFIEKQRLVGGVRQEQRLLLSLEQSLSLYKQAIHSEFCHLLIRGFYA